MKPKEVYLNLYYLFYRWSLRSSGKYENHRINAIAMISGMVLADFSSLFILVAVYTDLLDNFGSIPSWWALVISAVVIIGNVFLFGVGDTATRVIDNGASASRRLVHICNASIIGSVALFAFAWGSLLFSS